MNWEILRHPANWFVIFTMLLIWAFLGDILHAYMTGRHPSNFAQ